MAIISEISPFLKINNSSDFCDYKKVNKAHWCDNKKNLESINRIDKDKSVKNISNEYVVGAATVCDWKKNRSQTENFCSKLVSNENGLQLKLIKTNL